MPKEYPEYSSPDMVQNNWFDKPEKECSICGLDDEPIVIRMILDEDYEFKDFCRWCAELHYIRKHLKRHGTRRSKKPIEYVVAEIAMCIFLMAYFLKQVVFIG